MASWKELTIYIHGITPEENIAPHAAIYKGLHDAVNEKLAQLKKGQLGEPVTVEWGWIGSTGEDRYLEEAEKKVAAAEFEAYNNASEQWYKCFLFRLPRFFVEKTRPILLYGVADIFYYVSEDGKRAVRKTVFDAILKKLSDESQKMNFDDEGISLTCIGHSAGTVILHDLLFSIFFNYSKGALAQINYINTTTLGTIRGLAEKGKLRLRKFYTFGSPITPLMLRSKSLIDAVVHDPLKKKGFLDPRNIGLIDSIDLKNPRWVNFWDADDAISYPLEFLYENSGGLIEDRAIDVSGNPLTVHGEYWKDKKMIEYIAETY